MNKKFIQKGICSVAACALLVTSIFCGNVTSQAASKPTKLVLNKKQVKLKVGKNYKLKVKSVKPVKASKAVTYKTNKKKIATVSKKGVIKAIKEGKAVITVVSKKNKKLKAKVKVTVNKADNKQQSTNTVVTNAPATNATATNVPASNEPFVTVTDKPSEQTQAPITAPINIYSETDIAPVIMDQSYENNDLDQYAERTYDQISRAVTDLRQDISMVTGAIDYKEIQQIFCDSETSELKRINDAKAADAGKTMNLTAGEHTITLSAREDGIVLNQLCLTTNNSKTFTDGKFEVASATGK